ncbi:hypothetical protein SEA_PEPPERWOOD_236 [Streptomyces phage Pepperwood]|uniref:Uncharacterized protein n=1 Tax=Streptomyces phage Sushi23 TaxID=2015806 RepID=A0A222YY81_9CAUD|nr:hypothetical protein SEA_SUSHI23_237 [Streptomyces phage Sushi23]WDS51989.1 hypothetical protein SEA_PEPPERWOOD_236 [Streptomyces phage Pepperwood]
MDYRLLCENDYELHALEELEKSVNCEYAKNHHTYWQAANHALSVFKDMLWNRRNGGRA